MDQLTAITLLNTWGRRDRYVFTKHELAKLFPNDTAKAFTAGLNRLVKAGLIQRVCRGIYLNKEALVSDRYLLERIAKALRSGTYNYVSLESMLSEYGLISQIPIDRLTLMTTGREGLYETPYGTIEFTHTKRSVIDILKNTYHASERPLRMATKQAAWRDLKRVGRNLDLIQQENIDEK